MNKKNFVLKEIINNIPYYIFWKDKEHRYLGANRLFYLSAGYGSEDEIIGKCDYDCCWSKEQSDFFIKIDKQVMESNQEQLNIEEPQLQLDGSTKIVLTSKVPLHDEFGTVTGILGIYTDITDRKKLELEKDEAIKTLKNIQDRLVRTEKMKTVGEMAGGIAHEINNPLAIIAGLSSNLRKIINTGKYDPERAKLILDKIDTTVNRIGQITKSLKTISHSKSINELHHVKVETILEDLLGLVSEKLKFEQIQFITETPDLIMHKNIFCCQVSMGQVLLNLVNNSCDALADCENKKIYLKFKDMGNQLRIEVIDNGPGIPESLRDRIFIPFFTTKPVGKGTGLGLSLSKSLMENQGGDLHFESDPQNTSFFMLIPFSPQNQTKPLAPHPSIFLKRRTSDKFT